MKLNLFLISIFSITFNARADFSDTLYPKQWALKNIGQTIYLQDSDLSRKQLVGISGIDIGYQNTDNIPTKKNELIVAILDSGLDVNHPDLVGRVWYNSALCDGAPNAKNLPCNGYNFLDNNTDLTDDIGHGTHVAGIIAANKNNIGVVGAADSRIKIMPLKVLNNSVNGFVYNGKLITDVIADAMVFAIKNGAGVINLSLGWPKIIDTPKVRAAFQMAEEKNVMVIAASGNNNKDIPTFPCSYESVVCVSAINNQGSLTDFTNHGSKVDVAAPGEYIISTFPQNLESRVLRIKNYESKRGSSQAAPFVTASIATLKLLKPELVNDQVRLLLINSVNPPVKNDDRFIKFGILNQQQLYNSTIEQSKFSLIPLLKNLTEIKYSREKLNFSIQLPLKNLLSAENSGIVCFRSLSDSVKINEECKELAKVQPGSVTNLIFNGSILNIDEDSHVNFEIIINEKKYKLNLVFSRDLNGDSYVKNEVVNNGSIQDMMGISNGRRLSRMIRVLDKQNLISNPEYFFIEPSKQTESQTIISLLGKSNDAWNVKNLSLPKLNKVLSIHRQDINQDGSIDYMIYALSADKSSLKLFFFDKNLLPLFSTFSEWTWPLTTFEGLPIENGNEKFEWLKINTQNFGTIVVPSFMRIFSMPEEDNSKDILDRVISKENHEFYLSPKISNNKVLVDLRVFDSVVQMKKIKKTLNLDSSYRVEWIKNFPSNYFQFIRGEVKALLKVTNDEITKYFSVAMNSEAFKLEELKSTVPLEGSAIYKLINLENTQSNNGPVFTNLLNRSRANFVLRNENKIEYGNDLVNTWENPILSLIGAFKTDKQYFFMMENRYTISLSDEKGTFKYELPIYRDSSFPGQSFSETLNPISINNRPAVFINSTLVFGERLYSMIGDENGLKRPFYLSLSIPEGCAPLAPEKINGQESYSYMFLCVDQNKQISLKSLSMSEN